MAVVAPSRPGPFDEIGRTLLLVTVLVGVGCAVVALFVTRHLFRPLRSIAAAAKAIRRGDVNPGIPQVTGQGDLAAVAGSLADLVRALREREQELQLTNADLERRIEERTAEISRANAALERLASTDALTGLSNRHALHERFRDWRASNDDHLEQLCVAILDLDYFKAINDNYGHMAGDRVLCRVADILRKSIRTSDYVGRWGGEEFLIVMVGVSSHIARERIEALVQSVAEGRMVLDDETVIRVTASAGLASYSTPGVTFDERCRAADDALYRAKSLGRNRVEGCAHQPPDTSDRESVYELSGESDWDFTRDAA